MCKLINNAVVLLPCWLLFAATRITGQLKEKYIGCFADNERIHKLEPVLKDADNLTIEICIKKCYNDTNEIQSEMTFAALNNGRSCSCRKSAGDQLLDQNCNQKCTGAPVQVCGGNQNEKFYSLYTVCSVGYFGLECDQPCHCKSHSPCDRKSGICENGCEEHWTGSSCNISDIQKQYIGCYGDGLANDAMDVKNIGGKTGHNKNNTNSNEFCIEICSANYYTYAGMQYSYDCHCGEKYDKYENETFRGQRANCNYDCSANRSQKCGGNFALSVYYVCPVGFYGRDCISRCHCSNGGPCRFNGSCLTSPLSECKPGWKGSACNIRDCKVNNGDCGAKEQCAIIDLGYANTTACQLSAAHASERHYIGCYLDTRTAAMKRKFSWKNARNNTIESCMRHCASQNYTYAGLQYRYDCFCGNVYDRYGRLPESRCNMNCTGNDSQICGGLFANSVYAVNDTLQCSSDKDCKSNEKCFVSYLNYSSALRCQCKPGFHRMRNWEYCTDVDECKLRLSTCNLERATCINTIGSYICECKGGFLNMSGKCEDVDECQLGLSSSPCNALSEYCVNSVGSYICIPMEGSTGRFYTCVDFKTIGIILGTFLAISLLVNAILIVSRIRNAKSRNPEPGCGMTRSDFQPRSIQMSDQHEAHYQGIPESNGQNNGYEHIIPEQQRVVINPTCDYAELIRDSEYVNVESNTYITILQ